MRERKTLLSVGVLLLLVVSLRLISLFVEQNNAASPQVVCPQRAPVVLIRDKGLPASPPPSLPLQGEKDINNLPLADNTTTRGKKEEGATRADGVAVVVGGGDSVGARAAGAGGGTAGGGDSAGARAAGAGDETAGAGGETAGAGGETAGGGDSAGARAAGAGDETADAGGETAGGGGGTTGGGAGTDCNCACGDKEEAVTEEDRDKFSFANVAAGDHPKVGGNTKWTVNGETVEIPLKIVTVEDTPCFDQASYPAGHDVWKGPRHSPFDKKGKPYKELVANTLPDLVAANLSTLKSSDALPGYHNQSLTHVFVPYVSFQLESVYDSLRRWATMPPCVLGDEAVLKGLQPAATLPHLVFSRTYSYPHKEMSLSEARKAYASKIAEAEASELAKFMAVLEETGVAHCFSSVYASFAITPSNEDDHIKGTEAVWEHMIRRGKSGALRGRRGYALLLEPDCTPLKARWLTSLAVSVLWPVPPFLIKGALWQRGRYAGHDIATMHHINGNAMYRVSRYGVNSGTVGEPQGGWGDDGWTTDEHGRLTSLVPDTGAGPESPPQSSLVIPDGSVGCLWFNVVELYTDRYWPELKKKWPYDFQVYQLMIQGDTHLLQNHGLASQYVYTDLILSLSYRVWNAEVFSLQFPTAVIAHGGDRAEHPNDHSVT